MACAAETVLVGHQAFLPNHLSKDVPAAITLLSQSEPRWPCRPSCGATSRTKLTRMPSGARSRPAAGPSAFLQRAGKVFEPSELGETPEIANGQAARRWKACLSIISAASDARVPSKVLQGF